MILFQNRRKEDFFKKLTYCLVKIDHSRRDHKIIRMVQEIII